MITASDLSVRTGPGANYRRKTYEELTKNAKAHDYDKDGCLNYGTRVTVSKLMEIGRRFLVDGLLESI